MNLLELDFSDQREIIEKKLNEWNYATILAHLDIDGMTSSALLSKILRNKNIRFRVYPTNYEDFNKPINYKNVIILDLEVKEPYSANILDKNAIVIDHHNINPIEITLVNPKQKYPYYLPTSGHIFALYKEALEKEDWKAAIGIISDAGGKEWKEFIEKVSNYYNLNIGKDEYFFDSDLGKMAEKLNSLITLHGRRGALKVFFKLSTSKTIEELEKDKEIQSNYEKASKILNELKIDFEKNKIEEGRVLIYNIDSKYKRFSSTFSTSTAFENKNKVLAIYYKLNDEVYRFNIRSQVENLDLQEFLKINTNMIVQGGGHKGAVGVTVKENMVKEFINNLINYVNGKNQS
ncbi:MAG: DHHA1 domain-containing protein [Candidatus Parvarchaeota archaeon]|nr:DHHA1 domain-containing protein [Candidatus Rehaiarchaeum fermentans]